MAYTPYTLLLKRLKPSSLLKTFSTSSSPSSLSARLSFVFDQIDAIDKERAEKDQTLHKIRSWRETQLPKTLIPPTQNPTLPYSSDVGPPESSGAIKKQGEVVHPWPEWIEFMERLVQQNYFDHRRKDEDRMLEIMGVDAEVGGGSDGIVEEGLDFTDFKAVHTACLNFGKDRFDIFRGLSRQDIQILVGFGCASTDKKVVFSSKLLRKHTHFDEGDVCSSCSLRNSCERAYLITNKEDEARTIDIIHVLLAYGFDPINGSVENKSLLKQKSVKKVVRKLLHQVVKLSSVPIDPSLPPPVIKKPPPKVKQPPPPPRKRVGRDDIEMKKGDWLCSKCDFMNFAKNSLCLQCDAKRPKRQLLPGEWECPECNFLNYRRNMACFHCDCKRPPDEYIENNTNDRQRGPRTRMDNTPTRSEASNAWNFDFDDNESDGADVAAFEYADPVLREGSLDGQGQGEHYRHPQSNLSKNRGVSRDDHGEYSDADDRSGRGFDDFDDEEEDDIENYEVDSYTKDSAQKTSSIDFSELEVSESENSDGQESNLRARRTPSSSYNKPSKPMHRREANSLSDDDLDMNYDEDIPVFPNRRSSHVADSKTRGKGRDSNGPSKRASFLSDDDVGLYSDLDDDLDHNGRSRQGRPNKMGSGRKDFQKRRMFDSDDDLMSGSESDNRDFHSRKRSPRGNKPNSFKGAQFQSGGMKSGRKSSFSEDDDIGGSARGSRDNRGLRGNGFDGQRTTNRGADRQNFKGPKREGFKNADRRNSSRDDFDRPKRPAQGNNKGFREKNFDGHRSDRTSSRDFDRNDSRRPKREGFGKPQRERFTSDRSKDMDPSSFSNSRRVIER